MAAFGSVLMKLSVRGDVVILIVVAFRFALKRVGVGHKYIVGLWMMAFLFFVIPWKISLPVGFWGNITVPDEIWVEADTERSMNGNLPEKGGENIMTGMDEAGAVLPGDAGVSPMQTQKMAESAAVIPENPEAQNGTMPDGTGRGGLTREKRMNLFAVLWLAGLFICLGHMLYSCLKLKRKLLLSVLYRDHIWWAENIDMPMVFGPIHPQVYLPVGLEGENLSYVIAHEEMHIRRKDGLFKMAAYVICLIHWFNPFIWAAYRLLGSDLEKACDEEVIRSMEKEERKEYACALIRIAAGNGKRKRKIFVAPVGFDEGDLKSRVKNVMKYQYTLPGLGAVVLVAIIALAILLMTEAKEPEESLPAFYVEDLDSLDIGRSFSIEDCYITDRWAAGGHYYIDENGVLWGTGRNGYGQLGTGTFGFEEYYEEPVKIAENVISMDVSESGYFCIYLTDGGELYGLGSNCGGILLGEGSEVTQYRVEDYQKVTEPVLLMTDVVYARAGRECIVALQTNGSAYWWGTYALRALFRVHHYYEDYWRLEEDDANSVKMYVCEPRKIMDDCVYITTGTYSGAAINEAGELYTWGLNLFGQCGVPVTEDEFIRKPVKVMDDVKMVWVERIAFGDPEVQPAMYVEESPRYSYNTFLLTKDNTLMAAGLYLGDQERVLGLEEGLDEPFVYQYGDSFVPVRAVEYSAGLHLQALRELEFGMTLEEAENVLILAGQQVSRTTREHPYHPEAEAVCLCAEHNQYECYFDGRDRLESILIRAGGSRDGRFTQGMSLADLREAVEDAGGELVEGMDGNYIYEDAAQNITYRFHVNEDALTIVWEMDDGSPAM